VKKRTLVFISFVAVCAFLLLSANGQAQSATAGKAATHAAVARAHAGEYAVLTLVEAHDTPVMTRDSPGAEGNKYGFEGGTVVKVGDTYHMTPTEVVGDPQAVKTRMAHWTSKDRIHWTRVSTLYESSGAHDGTDPRASLWAPMPVYDAAGERWNLFYVAYNSLPDTPTVWWGNFDGQIWRAVSQVKGRAGIGGPYKDVGVILKPDAESEPWEGLQGTDSIYPYRVGDGWYGFYGSANTEKLPIEHWRVGLAKANSLAGPWKRVPELNPVQLETIFAENPIVTRAADGTYLAVYARSTVPTADNPTTLGYSVSRDGIHWSKGVGVDLQPTANVRWASRINTPLGLIAEGNDTFTLFYTGFVDKPFYENVGLVTLKLSYSKSAPVSSAGKK